MPFNEKKKQGISNVMFLFGRMVRTFVVCVGILLMAMGIAGCKDSEQTDEFWVVAEEVEDSAGEITAAEETEGDISKETEEIQTDGPAKQALFVVHICGAVLKPGVYELPQDSRIMDAVNAAGGFSSDAAQDARNLAERIADGTMIRIPTVQEAEAEQEMAQTQVSAAESSAGYADESNSSLVNINTANAAVLQTLPGIGESRAEAIIAYRKEHGAFSCIEDIMKVSGIKQAAFDRLKSQITV